MVQTLILQMSKLRPADFGDLSKAPLVGSGTAESMAMHRPGQLLPLAETVINK